MLGGLVGGGDVLCPVETVATDGKRGMSSEFVDVVEVLFFGEDDVLALMVAQDLESLLQVGVEVY
jgi:hypothetical protein